MAFALMGPLAVLFLAALVGGEGSLKLPALHQTGDSSLSRKSVNWLGAIAFIAALLICLI